MMMRLFFMLVFRLFAYSIFRLTPKQKPHCHYLAVGFRNLFLICLQPGCHAASQQSVFQQ